MSEPVEPGRWLVDGCSVEVRIPARPKHGPNDRVLLVDGEQLSFETFLYEAHGHKVRGWPPSVIALVREFFRDNEDIIYPHGMGGRMLTMVEDIAQYAGLDEGLRALDMTMTLGQGVTHRLRRWHGRVMEQVAADPHCPACLGQDLRRARSRRILVCNHCCPA